MVSNKETPGDKKSKHPAKFVYRRVLRSTAIFSLGYDFWDEDKRWEVLNLWYCVTGEGTKNVFFVFYTNKQFKETIC